MGVTTTQLVPIKELTPGAVGAIRNQVIEALVAQASRELNLPPTKLVVRDVRPFNDLQMYSGGTTNSTVDTWAFDTTTVTAGTYTTVTGTKQMGDQRYVALFGVRDIRGAQGLHTTAMGTAPTGVYGSTGTGVSGGFSGAWPQTVNHVKVNVGGADKVIWDITGLYAYYDSMVGITPSAVVIPQNASFNIYYALRAHRTNSALTPGMSVRIQLVGVTVEPRGKVISP